MDAPNVPWVADITFVPTWAGFLYLAVVLDAFSRRVIGWAMGTRQRTQLVLDAMNMAVTQRKPSSVIHHSDQGSHGGFNRSSQHPFDGGADDKNRQTKVRTFDPGKIKLSRKAANLAT